MFLKRSPVSYRVKKSRVGKKLKNHTRLFFVLGTVLLALILTVVWGLIWGEKAQASAEKRAEARLQEQALAAAIPDWLPDQPDPVRASYLGRITTLDAASAAIAALTEDGADALSEAVDNIGCGDDLFLENIAFMRKNCCDTCACLPLFKGYMTDLDALYICDGVARALFHSADVDVVF